MTLDSEQEKEVMDYVTDLENQVANLKGEEGKASAMNIISSPENQNIVEWQLDFTSELLDIERLLRNQRPEKQKDGNVVYVDPPKEERIFNERGIQTILKLLKWYLNKNIVLSNFKEDVIDLRLHQFANALRRLIYLNYKDFGLDTDYKIKHYEMMTINIVDIIEAAYNRAFKGGERDSLRSVRTVTQQQQMGVIPQPYNQPIQPQRRGSKLNPMNWF